MSLPLIPFSPNTRIKSSEVNANFNALNGELFDITEENFNPGAQLPDSLLDTINTPDKIDGAAITTQTIDAVKGQFTWTVSGTLVVAASQSFPLRPSAALTAVGVFLEVTTAPTGTPLIIDINKAGVSIFSTRPQIDVGVFVGGGGAVFSPSPLILAPDDKLTIDIDQVGSTVAGANLVISLRCEQKVPQ